MNTFHIITLIVFLINLVFCYLFRTAFYCKDDKKPIFSLGVAIIVGLLSLVPGLNIVIFIGFFVALISYVLDSYECYVQFDNEFLEKLFKR